MKKKAAEEVEGATARKEFSEDATKEGGGRGKGGGEGGASAPRSRLALSGSKPENVRGDSA